VLDVVEHIEDDVAALKGMASLLRPGGKILIAVPAHQWLWSAHDVVNHHHRRYSKASLVKAIAAAGLAPRKLTYFNSLLFPLAAAARIAGRLTGRDDSDDSPPAKPLNALFEKIFRLERHAVGRVPLTLACRSSRWRSRAADLRTDGGARGTRPFSPRHPGLVPGSTPRRGDGLEAPTQPLRPGGPRNKSGVTEQVGRVDRHPQVSDNAFTPPSRDR